MITVVFTLNSSKHSVLILVRFLEFVLKQVFMERLLADENLLLVADNHFSRRNSDGQFHFQSLAFLLLSFKPCLFLVGKEPTRATFLKNVVYRGVLLIGHLDDDLDFLVLQDSIHVWNEINVSSSIDVYLS
jgi:hypothetical protein